MELPEGMQPQPLAPLWMRRSLAALAVVGTALIFGLALLINADVLGRALGHPVRGTPELVGMSIVAIVFLQLPNTLAGGHLIRSEVLIERLERRRPAWGQALHGLYEIAGAALFAALCWGMVAMVAEDRELGSYVGASGDFTAPVWPVHAIVALGALLTAAQYAVLAFGRLARILARPAATPATQPAE